MESWQRTVASMSDHLFPGLYEVHHENKVKLGNRVIANLPLQMALYFNVILFPFWLVITIVMLDTKFECLSVIYQVVVITTLIAVIFLEAVRLFLGYSGNLGEKIPDLAGFWMLSILLQFPLQTFLLVNPHFKSHIIEIVVQLTMVSFLTVQLISGYIALKSVASHQSLHFRLKQLQFDIDTHVALKKVN